MKGIVEIWQGDRLLHTEENLIMDGAGELLADIMTVSPSIATLVGSESLLDASNFMIQAISFGTGEEAFVHNAYYSSDLKNNTVRDAVTTDFALGNKIQRVLTHLPTANPVYDSNGVSSYVPRAGLPSAPNPAQTKLEDNSRCSGEAGVFIGASPAVSGPVSSTVIPQNQGQLRNMLPYNLISSIIEQDTEIRDSIPDAFAAFDDVIMQAVYSQIGSYLGGFADSSSTSTSTVVSTFSGTQENYDSSNTVFSDTDVTGYFNSASSMDVNGFINLIMSSVPHSGYQMSSGQYGLTMSASPDFSSTGEIQFGVDLAPGDLLLANLYGGIYHIGLWSIDNKATIINGGNLPPYQFSQLNNPRKYKLFSKKTFNVNLCDILDV